MLDRLTREDGVLVNFSSSGRDGYLLGGCGIWIEVHHIVPHHSQVSEAFDEDSAIDGPGQR